MHTKLLTLFFLFSVVLSNNALADNAHKDEHGGKIFHKFTLETDIGTDQNDTIYSWDFEGWIGTDKNKLWLKAEGEKEDRPPVEQSEFWAMYSRNVSTFWDLQTGFRFDEQPDATSYFISGIHGLAPYFIETESHLFVSEDGDLTARLKQKKGFLITQKLITEPYIELNFSAQDVQELEIGSGITDGEFGLQTRYEIIRKFAPYVDFKYERKFGETSSLARKNNEKRDNFITSLGIRFMF